MSVPRRVDRLRARVAEVDLGDLHSAVISSIGVLFAFGDNSMGQLGIGNSQLPLCADPVEVATIREPVK